MTFSGGEPEERRYGSDPTQDTTRRERRLLWEKGFTAL